jgi:hypothetical protein
MHNIFLTVIVDGNIPLFLVALLTFAYALSVEFHERFPFVACPNRGQHAPVCSSAPGLRVGD